MNILAIDTSCDETSVAVTSGRHVLSNIIFSQIEVHKPYGGVYPTIAKREHATKINPAVALAVKRARLTLAAIDAYAVTFGPGLAPALEIGIKKAQELARHAKKPLIPVDHIEGHIYSPFVQNRNGKPEREFSFPILSLIVSGGHTQLTIFNNHISYQTIGATLDDAAGEALDKASRLLGLGYPGGPVIERLAQNGDPQQYSLPAPMIHYKNLQFSYSGLKTAFKRLLEGLSDKQVRDNLQHLCASFQNAVIISLVKKCERALQTVTPNALSLTGGVAQNKALRTALNGLAKQYNTPLYLPPYQYLSTDNAAMIGVAAYYKYQKKIFLTGESINQLDRVPRADLDRYSA